MWLFHGFYDREWWQEPDTVFTYSCTADQLYEVVDRSFAIQQFPINSNRDKKAVGDLVRHVPCISPLYYCACMNMFIVVSD